MTSVFCAAICFLLSVWLLGWRDRFDFVVGGVIVAPLVVPLLYSWRSWRRRVAEDDWNALGRDSTMTTAETAPADGHPSSILLDALAGILAGTIAVILASVLIHSLRGTGVESWFVDVEGKNLLVEIDTLRRNKSWHAIVSKATATVPPKIGSAARRDLMTSGVEALIAMGNEAGGPPNGCTSYAQAKELAEAEHLDSTLASAKVQGCELLRKGRALPAGVKIDVRAIERARGDQWRLTVRVLDEALRPVGGLTKDDFDVHIGGNRVVLDDIESLSKQTRLRRRIVFIVGSTETGQASLIPVAQFLAASLSEADTGELVSCDSHNPKSSRFDDAFAMMMQLPSLTKQNACRLSEGLSVASRLVNGRPGEIVLVITGNEKTDDVSELDRASGLLAGTGTPVWIASLSERAPTALQALAKIEQSTTYHLQSRSGRDQLRARLRNFRQDEPYYHLRFRYAAASHGQLEVLVGGDNAVSASSRF